MNLQESSLYQHVEYPTRGNNILDIILTTNDNLVNNVKIGPEFSSSDHLIIEFDITAEKVKEAESKEKVPDYRKADFIRLKALLTTTDWNQMTETDDINQTWEIFTQKVNAAIKLCVPLRNRRPNSNGKPKWWSNEIKSSLLAKKHAYHRYKTTLNNDDKLEFDNLRRISKRLIKQSKRALEIHIANTCKSNPKEFYSYIRKKKVMTSNIGPLETNNGRHTENEIEMANILNDYFASVFTIENTTNSPQSPINLANNGVLENLAIHNSDILSAIDRMKKNKTPGPDKISPRILKEAKNELLLPLSVLFNKSLNSGKVPCE